VTLVACMRAFMLAGIPVFYELLEVLELPLALLSCKKCRLASAGMPETKAV
jgi:hypothetical protein